MSLLNKLSLLSVLRLPLCSWLTKLTIHYSCKSGSSPQGPVCSWCSLCIMFVLKRDGRKEPVHFDKITARITKLSYGLNTDFCDPVRYTPPLMSVVDTVAAWPGNLRVYRLRGLLCWYCLRRCPCFLLLVSSKNERYAGHGGSKSRSGCVQRCDHQ